MNIVIQASELGIWELDLKTKALKYSDRYLEIIGLKGKNPIEHEDTRYLIHPEDKEMRDEAYRQAYRNGVFNFTGRLCWQDGSLHWVDAKGKVFYDGEKRPSYLIGTIRDITDEKIQQEILVKSEQKFRLLADSMPQFIWTGDGEGNLNYFNQAVYDYSGLSTEDVIESGWLQIVHPDDREENIKTWTKSVGEGIDFLFEHRFKKADGQYRWQLSRAIPQRNAVGKIQMWVGTSTDIQEQKEFVSELEKQVRERTDELNQKNLQLEKMNGELESFAYVSSHDLQEPLRKIQTFANLIVEKENQNLTEKAKDYFRRMQSAANRMQTLIQDLLAYSRTNTSERVYTQVGLADIVQDVKNEYKENIADNKVTIEVGTMCQASVIVFQFRQLLHNLIGNSLKFAKEGVAAHIKIDGEKSKRRRYKNTGNFTGQNLLPYLCIR